MHIYFLFYIIFHYGSSNSEGLNKYRSLGYTGPIVYRQQILIEIVLGAAQPSARCSGGYKGMHDTVITLKELPVSGEHWASTDQTIVHDQVH